MKEKINTLVKKFLIIVLPVFIFIPSYAHAANEEPFTLPKLPYAYDSLEPFIDAQTMTIHHQKHHKAYVDKLNTAINKYPELKKKSLKELLSDLDAIPEDIRSAVRNNGGGHYNHSFFWTIMGKGKGSEPKGKLKTDIEKSFGSFNKFKDLFKEAALNQFGSGWAWLVRDNDGALKIITTANQDNPIMHGIEPILGIDVWEHAYYLKYQNNRAGYIDAWWNVVNWNEIEKNYK
jgi:Fe-Mn family superoxide dismutase